MRDDGGIEEPKFGFCSEEIILNSLFGVLAICPKCISKPGRSRCCHWVTSLTKAPRKATMATLMLLKVPDLARFFRRFFRAPVFVLVNMNGPFGGARLNIAQNAFHFDQCLGIGRALRVQQGIEILDGDGLPARSHVGYSIALPSQNPRL